MAGEKRSYYLWLVAAVLGALLVLAAPLQLYISFGGSAEEAIRQGKRIEINLKTGEIKQLDPEAEKAAEAKEEEKPAEETVAEEKPAAAEPEKHEQAEEAPAAEEKKVAEGEEKVLPKPLEAEKGHADEMHAKPAHPEPLAEQKTETVAPAAAPVPIASSSSGAAAAAIVPKKPRIALVVVGLGLSRSSTDSALELPAGIALSFSPYAFELAQWMEKAGSARERYLDLPLEPSDYPYSDPGPFALLTGLDDAKNKERFEQVLARANGFTGLVSGPDEKFTENASSFALLLGELKAKKLFYVYSARSENYKFRQAADAAGTPLLGSDRVIDAGLSAETIDAELKALEEKAKESGYAIGMGRPYPVTIQRLSAWVKTLEGKGIELVPLSSLKAEKL